MHPARLVNQKDETPIPFKRQYNQPGLLYPISNHALRVTDQEFASVAYAFLDSLARIGSGNPKGVALAESDDKMPLVVVDRYLVPRGKRPVISPSVISPEEAITDFIRLARTPDNSTDHIALAHFDRWIGDAALEKLQDYSSQFVDTVLQA
jgi:hypothetical protein